jgi:hypothetical protein
MTSAEAVEKRDAQFLFRLATWALIVGCESCSSRPALEKLLSSKTLQKASSLRKSIYHLRCAGLLAFDISIRQDKKKDGKEPSFSMHA